ncbi:MAG: DRTGG domain-containing protein [Acidaminococcaceae bacterium]|nr:DRTGG domain-containing protein [Acidaminococcaceae bacterium]MDD4722196.1 DRTGG domain-containing protein [Acidaminococcaceae bacterium]
MLKLSEVQRALEARSIVGEDKLDREAESAFGADLMSDVLAFTRKKTLLLTGLTNVQVIRTADVSELSAIVFVRGKMPGTEILQVAKNCDIPVLLTKYTMFEACGILYKLGLPACPVKELKDE